MSKNDKINKITELTTSIQAAGTEIECLGLLHKIVVLQLNQAAIQFFKRDKFLTYNHTVNIIIQKQVEYTQVKMDFFRQINEQNSQQKQASGSVTGKGYQELLAEIQPQTQTEIQEMQEQPPETQNMMASKIPDFNASLKPRDSLKASVIPVASPTGEKQFDQFREPAESMVNFAPPKATATTKN
jgi:hypothetical protein